MSVRFIRVTTISLILAGLVSACSESSIPFSGGALEGTVVPAPEDWSEVAAQEVIKLETNPGEPYSVNLWIIGMDQMLYVHAGVNRTTWVEHMEADPTVRLGSEGEIYSLVSERVTDQDEFDGFSEVYKEKYGRYPRNRDINEAYLYRLTPGGP